MSLLNTEFKNFNKEQKEFRAVPPEKDFVVYANQNKLVVNDTKNPQDITNGEYIANSSSETIWKPAHAAIRAFDKDTTSFWHTPWCCGYGYKHGAYERGKYIGGGSSRHYFTTTTTTGESIAGEWLEIKLPYRLQMTKYEILTSTHCCPTRFPTKFTMLGSNDGTTWVVLDQQRIQGDPQNSYNLLQPVPFQISKHINEYNVFRIVFEGSMYNRYEGVMNISQLNIYGLFPCINMIGQCENIQTYSNNTMSKIEGMSLMENEMQLLADLKSFNDKYARYITCQANSNGCNTNTDLDAGVVTAAYDRIILTNNNELTGGSLYAVYNTQLNKFKTNAEYDISHNEISNTHSDIMKLRSELDIKLKELYATEDSMTYEQKRVFDGAVYTSLIWTVLATSTLFYVFKHM